MIRIKALAMIVRPDDGALLVCEGEDEAGNRFARPVGGSVEFGELARDAMCREIQEELGCDLIAVSLALVLENRFTWNGSAGHEVVFVFHGELADASLYDRDSLPILDVPDLQAVWWSPETHRSRLVPDGIHELLVRET